MKLFAVMIAALVAFAILFLCGCTVERTNNEHDGAGFRISSKPPARIVKADTVDSWEPN